MPLRIQIHPKMYRNSMILAPKKTNLRPKCDFREVFALDDFWNSISQLFWWDFISKWGPGQKQLSNFCVYFGSQNCFFEATVFFIDSALKNIDKMLKFESDYLKIPWDLFQMRSKFLCQARQSSRYRCRCRCRYRYRYIDRHWYECRYRYKASYFGAGGVSALPLQLLLSFP